MKPTPMQIETTTQRLVLAEDDPQAVMRAAGEALRQGGVVVFPTETYYGLAVRPQDSVAVDRLAQLKMRLGDKPIPLIAASRQAAAQIGPMPVAMEPLIAAFWPGPLTVALRPNGDWPQAITGDGTTVGVRVPGHDIARRLAEAAGGLITATSANPAGGAPPRAADQIDPVLADRCAVIIDGGLSSGGMPSTVVGLEDGKVVILRAGRIGVQALTETLGYAPRQGPRE